MAAADTNGDDVIQYNEFLPAMVKILQRTKVGGCTSRGWVAAGWVRDASWGGPSAGCLLGSQAQVKP